ncbi:helix-turn-helix domain-containing protein [Allosphingosinicella vermicomposti]|uniref:helix-turn-helix domain-containing protein n=1 Tax=Allosphingosinicella vermicomposti TaxID=614671 RepID=UPI000D114153|nr:helix-turn-helix transcriptional regulator [Allosphingosinicella vermicomposti]
MLGSTPPKLTQRQKDCLDLVAQGYTAKQIGRHLGLSDSTVNNHINDAKNALQTRDKGEAARLYLELYSDPSRHKLPSQSAGLVHALDVEDEVPATQPSGWRRVWTWIVPRMGGQENALSTSQTILAVFHVALFGALLFIAALMIVKASFYALT